MIVKEKRGKVQRDKVTGFLDSLANAEGMGPEWVCFHKWVDGEKRGFLNDYREGYTTHPNGNTPSGWTHCDKSIKPIPGEKYMMVKLEGDDVSGKYVITHWMEITYPKRSFSEERLMEMYGLSRTQGYYPKREFYQPDEFDLTSSAPDPRNLLQWQPAVMTDDNGVAEITFAASDLNTEFIGIVEAIDGSGLMGCQTFSFRVLKK